ncbi:glycoside hydrolase family 3 protein [Bdellovibrio reynosensis]|uniref:Glycoside hydrolase family 3 protein n=1 Tax=Bdellovibrio reynosensis TaxID=2835041 RepID=A0ABY4C9S3_9BACT|nr:glycoside hydrolase family 3 protein [Bdellovibrio reynosensis]UOF00416.1 glycoside hydrolase family 3 protein [Bdellovibrio reynosensis]
MGKYIREIIQNFSLSLLIFLFPHLVLASESKTAPNLQKIITEKIAQMSLEEKVGQLFIIGFPQKEIGPDLEKFLSEYKPGSFLLFKRNITSGEQIRDLNNQLYRKSYLYTKLPPLIAIDQEGGTVSRLPIKPAPPNALAIGQTQSPLLAEEMGYQTGLFLREVGFNMNLAPVLDVSDPLTGSFIGVRSFGANPKIVGEIGVAYSKGLLKARVIPTAKHFPGTGNLKADPHHSVVMNKSSLETLQSRDLKPFEAYNSLGENIAVMLSHLIYPALDKSNEPASFSKEISTVLLREKMKFAGLVVTDDLQMQGSKQLLRPEAAALKALQAGADVVMLTWSFEDQAKAFDFVKAAVKNNELPETDLNKKLSRILTVKAFANLYRRNPHQPSLLAGPVMTSKSYAKVEENILDQNLKTNLIAREQQTKERTPSSISKVCVLSPSSTFNSSFKKTAKKETKVLLLSAKSTSEEITAWINKENCPASVIAVTGPKTATTVKALSEDLRGTLIVVNLGSPRLFNEGKGYRKVLQLYFNHKDSGKKVAQHLDEILNANTSHYVLR